MYFCSKFMYRAMKRILLIFVALIGTLVVNAQNPEGFAMQGGPMRQHLSPEQQAAMITEQMKQTLELSPEQLKLITELNLQKAQAEEYSREQMRKFMQQMRQGQQALEQAVDEQLKLILNDSQYKKWLKQKQQQHNRAMRHGQGQQMPRGGGFNSGGQQGAGGFEGGAGGMDGGFGNEMGF